MFYHRAVKTDQRIVRSMWELLRVQGYTATGIQQLARAQRTAEPLLAAGRAVSAYIATLPVTAPA